MCTRIGFAALVLLLAARVDAGESWTGKVVGVADGDTITVLHDRTPEKIRLHGVDAPEKAQPFGEKSKQLTSGLVFGKEVRVEVVTRDKYGRTVARVYTLNPPACLEEELVKAGLAWWYRKYDPKNAKLAKLEEEARKARRGLWADASPTPPWEWRHSGAKGAPAAPTAPAAGATYHGNSKSKTLHAPGCRDYDCKACTAGFKTVDEARKAGYRPHLACVTPFEKCYTECLRRSQMKAVKWEMIEADCRKRCTK
jgi:micrococcal nuclease